MAYWLRAADLVFDPTLACSGVRVGPKQQRLLSTDRFTHFTNASRHPFDDTKAGLTSKPRHAQRPQDALRGSFCPRLASTFNHSLPATSNILRFSDEAFEKKRLRGRETAFRADRPPVAVAGGALHGPYGPRTSGHWRDGPEPWPEVLEPARHPRCA